MFRFKVKLPGGKARIQDVEGMQVLLGRSPGNTENLVVVAFGHLPNSQKPAPKRPAGSLSAGT